MLGLAEGMPSSERDRLISTCWHAELDKNLPDTNIVITTPFHPAYMTRDRIMKAPKLELILTAGVGSDHIDLHAAADKGITVAEVTTSSAHLSNSAPFCPHNAR